MSNTLQDINVNTVIDRFRGEYRFLSNFYTHSNNLSAEHHYQAAKATNISDYFKIMNASSPGKAKQLAKTIKIRDDWESIKLIVMEQILIDKFTDVDLAKRLLATGDSTLIEGNSWGDHYWGICNGIGQNHLGKILMKIRDEYLAVPELLMYNY